MKKVFAVLFLFVFINIINSNAQSISGPSSVCLNGEYTYSISEGAFINWSVTGGTIIGSSTSTSVVIKWTSTGNKVLSVSYFGQQTPALRSISTEGYIMDDTSMTENNKEKSNVSLKNAQNSSNNISALRSGGGKSNITLNKSITVNSSNGGTLSGGVSVCGNAKATLSISGASGTIEWQKRPEETSNWITVQTGGSTYWTGSVSFNTEYRVKATSCNVTTSNSVWVRIKPSSKGGATSVGGTFCESKSGTITLSGHRGSILKWEKRTNGDPWEKLNNASASQGYNHSTVGAYEYRAQVKNNDCPAAYSSSTTVIISPASVGGEVTVNGSSEINVCLGALVPLELSGHIGYVNKWEKRNIDSELKRWETISLTDAKYDLRANQVNATEYMAQVQSPACAVKYSTSITVVTDSPVSLGTMTGGGTVCQGSDGEVTLINSSGRVLRWEMSEYNGTSWGITTNIENVTTTHPYSNIQKTTRLRAIFADPCDAGESTSSYAILTVTPLTVAKPLIISSENDCSSHFSGLEIDGDTQDLVEWQEYIEGSGYTATSKVIPKLGGDQFLVSNLEGGEIFRAIFDNGCGDPQPSNSVTIYKNESKTEGTITQDSGDPLVLNGGSGTLSATVTNGDTEWWASTDEGANYALIPGENTGSYDYTVSTTTQFQARVTDVNCLTRISSPLEIEVRSSGLLTGPSQAAYGEEVTLDLSGHEGAIINWEVSFDGGSTYQLLDPDFNSGVGEEAHFSAYRFTLLEDTWFRAKVDIEDFGIQYKYKEITVDRSAPAQTNYRQVQSTRLLVEEHNPSMVPASGEGALTQVAYVDGLGRTLKTVAINSTSAKKDVVAFGAYDPNSTIQTGFMPFVKDDATGSQIDISELIEDQKDYYQSGGANMAHSGKATAEVELEASPLGRVLQQGAVGEAWQLDGGHTVRYAYRTNEEDEVRQWNPDASSDGFYPAHSLWVTEATDENGNRSRTYSDKFGKTVQTQREHAADQWLTKGYVFDELGRTKTVLSPKAMNGVPASGAYAFTADILGTLAYGYTYDGQGRLVEKKIPGKAPEYYIYDTMDRLVLSQDGLLRETDQWKYVKYDQRHRVVMTGLYTNDKSRADMQSQVDSHADSHYEVKENSTDHGYSNQAFPTSGTEVLSVRYYDSYDFDRDGTEDHGYAPSGLSPGPVPFDRVRGWPTGSKTKVLGTAQWLTSVAFYDKKGRTVQTQSDNHLGGTDVTTMVYDFVGRVTHSKTVHDNGSEQHTVHQRNTYDHVGRLLKSYMQVDEEPEIEVASLRYNELGQLIEKNLHQVDEGGYLQSMDMSYNIRGWLTGINDHTLNGQETEAQPDYFGMEFFYTENEASNKLYDGNIAAVRWNKMGDEGASMYDYTYDKANRLTAADYKMKGVDWGSNAIQQNFYSTTTDYDLNGNITTLNRNGLDGTMTSIDQLSYTYQGNQMQAVTDAAGHEAGFNDLANETDEYTYDANGNMASDLNKGIDSIAYNYQNKPVFIQFADGRTVTNTYTASGAKIRQQATDTEGVVQKVNDYLGNFLYQDNQLQAIQHGEGRILYHPEESDQWEHQYHLTDQLGNVRMLLTTDQKSTVTQATMESSQAEVEAGIFFNYEKVAVVNADLFDHTNSQTDTTRNSMMLSGGDTLIFARQLKVMPGDTVKMEVFAKYYDQAQSSGWTQLLNTVAGNIANGSALIANELGGMGSTAPFIDFTRSGVDQEVPKAYLNYMVFDKDFQLISAKTGFEQISSAAQETGTDTPHEALSHTIAIEEMGYVYIYLSNESETGVDVFFDDFTVEQVHGPIVQANDYYPFGLQTAGSYEQDLNTINNRLYNAGSELNRTTNNYETFYRNYDAALGRFTGIDIMASSFTSMTPYQYAFNNPINYNDPMGDIPKQMDKGELLESLDGSSGSSYGGGLANNGMGGWDFWGGIAAGYGDSYNSGSAFGFGHGGTMAEIQARRRAKEESEALAGEQSAFASAALANNGGYWHSSTRGRGLLFANSEGGSRLAYSFGSNYNDLHNSWNSTEWSSGPVLAYSGFISEMSAYASAGRRAAKSGLLASNGQATGGDNDTQWGIMPEGVDGMSGASNTRYLGQNNPNPSQNVDISGQIQKQMADLVRENPDIALKIYTTVMPKNEFENGVLFGVAYGTLGALTGLSQVLFNPVVHPKRLMQGVGTGAVVGFGLGWSLGFSSWKGGSEFSSKIP
ncbi:RHS repeat-associated core domain-containing protein [Reichenbachiella faecimaris]|uniref:RHS repeat-associated core domain-containing protein n=1 Tax=Reichenbachiella faecimaris TaxID=692418 RepID=A0A1W2G711_REIFA|nr:DUF6443 domain-containing protein [Reichenbachiella faecimaris]SMD32304.1 RHS repeat-associated core domain-containing protein [Reichenbachiella faecimaris]